MSKTLNIKAVAGNFVQFQQDISEHVLAGKLQQNSVQKKVHRQVAETASKINVLRLLALTGNLSADDFFAQVEPLNTELDRLNKLLYS